MTADALPVALLAAALALMLAFAAPGARWWGIGAVIAGAVAGWVLAGDPPAAALWASAALTALLVHWPRGAPAWAAALAGGNAGLWAGASSPGTAAILLAALPLTFGGAWVVARGAGLALKIAAGWLVAVALLAAMLPLVSSPATTPEHRD